MTRILGEHFTTEGKPKRGFPTRRAAEKFVRKKHLNVEIYLCSFCKKHHLATVKEEE